MAVQSLTIGQLTQSSKDFALIRSEELTLEEGEVTDPQDACGGHTPGLGPRHGSPENNLMDPHGLKDPDQRHPLVQGPQLWGGHQMGGICLDQGQDDQDKHQVDPSKGHLGLDKDQLCLQLCLYMGQLCLDIGQLCLDMGQLCLDRGLDDLDMTQICLPQCL